MQQWLEQDYVNMLAISEVSGTYESPDLAPNIQFMGKYLSLGNNQVIGFHDFLKHLRAVASTLTVS